MSVLRGPRLPLRLAALEPRDLPSTLIPVPDRNDLIFDDVRGRLYVTTDHGTVERFDVATGTMLTSWVLDGGLVGGGDLPPDGKFLYVADGDQLQVWKIDVATGAAKALPYTTPGGALHSFDVTIAANGLGFVISDQGWNGDLVQLDTA